jgi:hypothetical protein
VCMYRETDLNSRKFKSSIAISDEKT